MKLMGLIFFIFSTAFGAIHGPDDRQEYFEMPHAIQEVALSSVALIPKKHLTKFKNSYRIDVKSVGKTFKMCEDVLFRDQPLLANCSAALIAKNRILTAAHCIDSKYEGRRMQDYYAVFNYYMHDANIPSEISAENVFELKKEIYHNYDMENFDAIDLAVYELDRKATYPAAKINFETPLLGEEIFILGYPLGVPIKYSPDSKITSLSQNSFRHNLDTFSVNSGSPVFNADYEIIGVHVRGTGSNIDYQSRECTDWFKSTDQRDYEEANHMTVLKNILK